MWCHRDGVPTCDARRKDALVLSLSNVLAFFMLALYCICRFFVRSHLKCSYAAGFGFTSEFCHLIVIIMRRPCQQSHHIIQPSGGTG